MKEAPVQRSATNEILQPQPQLQVGDKVKYIPDKCHSTQKGIDGEYPWVFGRVKRAVGDKEPEVVELTSTKDVDDLLRYIRSHPQPAQARKEMALIRPNRTWPAVVTAANEDGTYDLDIESNQGGVTLHYKSVKLDPSGKAAHTCHAATPPASAPEESEPE
jgi:hypothetical protein